MERRKQSRIYRKLYGCNYPSKYGRYHHRDKGILDTIPCIMYEDGNFMIPEGNRRKVIGFLKKNNASYMVRRIIPKREDLEKLRIT
ncbi:MAG: hypothetical protein ACP5UZ_07855 [Thermoplasmata archaeon]